MSERPIESLLGYQLRRASAAMFADLAARLAELDLSVPGMSVLFTIAGDARLTQSDIGRRLGIQRANMAPLAAQLEEAGLVERVMLDGRSHALVLTRRGVARLAKARAIVVEHEAQCLGALSAEQRDGLIEMLGRLWT